MCKELYIVGNGFDMAHGLETSLRCFKCYLKHKDNDSRKFLESLSQYVPVNETWSNFEDALCKIDSEQINDDAMDYVQPTWSDKFRDSSWEEPGYVASEAVAFSHEISCYLHKWIKSIRVESQYKFSIPDDSFFLSFNYTNTLEIIYGIPKNKICYIHGDASSEDILICGHNDTSLLKEKVIHDSDYAYQQQTINDTLQDYYRKTWKNPSAQIKKFQDFFEQLNSVEKIKIIGHSFENDIDSDYFAYIKEKVNQNCKWEISYHSEFDKECNEKFLQKMGIKKYEQFEIK